MLLCRVETRPPRRRRRPMSRGNPFARSNAYASPPGNGHALTTRPRPGRKFNIVRARSPVVSAHGGGWLPSLPSEFHKSFRYLLRSRWPVAGVFIVNETLNETRRNTQKLFSHHEETVLQKLFYKLRRRFVPREKKGWSGAVPRKS